MRGTFDDHLHLRWQARADAGSHRHARRRRLGLGHREEPARPLPQGRSEQGRIVCERDKEEPCKSFLAPFHLGIDQQDRLWVANSAIDHVTRSSAAAPSKAEKFKTGFNNSGLAIDSQGNVWVTARFGSGLLGMAPLIDLDARLRLEGVANASDYLTKTMSRQGGRDGGSVTLLRPDGTQYPGSPFIGGGLPGPWAAVVDGNDNVWISNFAMPSSPIAQLCGVRIENCQDRRSDLAARWIRGRRPAVADRYRRRSGRQCLGDEQLAGHRQLYRYAQRGALDALWRPGRRSLLRNGQVGPRAADRPGPTTVVHRSSGRFGGATPHTRSSKHWSR